MRVRADLWIPILARIYPALSQRYQVIVGGSQIFYLVAGRAFESKDIDLFIEDYNPLEVSRIIAETLSLGEERFEFFRRGDNMVTHLFIPLPGRYILSIEVMNRHTPGKNKRIPTLQRGYIGREGWE